MAEEDLFQGRRRSGLSVGGGGARVAVAQARKVVVGHHFAGGDDEHALAGGGHLWEDVGGEHDGVLAGERLDQLPHLDDLGGIEADGGLVEDEHLRVAEQRLGEAHSLPLALGEVPDHPLDELVAVGLLRHPLDLDAARLGGDALDRGDEGQVVAHRHLRIERRVLRQVADALLHLERLLEDVEAAHFHAAARRRDHAGEDAHGGGLAGAVGSEEAQDLARLHLEGDVLYGLQVAVVLHQMRDFDHGIHTLRGPRCGHPPRRLRRAASQTRGFHPRRAQFRASPPGVKMQLRRGAPILNSEGASGAADLRPRGLRWATPPTSCSRSRAR